MSRQHIIRAWKDAEYRASLSEAERALLPEHPAGLIELPEEDLDAAAGAAIAGAGGFPFSADCSLYYIRPGWNC